MVAYRLAATLSYISVFVEGIWGKTLVPKIYIDAPLFLTPHENTRAFISLLQTWAIHQLLLSAAIPLLVLVSFGWSSKFVRDHVFAALLLSFGWVLVFGAWDIVGNLVVISRLGFLAIVFSLPIMWAIIILPLATATILVFFACRSALGKPAF
jgi:hypothetical protein